MPALDLIRPSVTAMRVIASVNDGFARELKLPSHIRSLGLITADSDDVTYIAADEATKQAMVEVVYGRSLYAGAAHGPSPTAGEVLILSLIHISEPTRLGMISYAVFCLKKKN